MCDRVRIVAFEDSVSTQCSLTHLPKDKDAISLLIRPLLPQALILTSFTINCTLWFSFCSVTVLLNIIWLSSLCKSILCFHQVWLSQHSIFYFGSFLSWRYSCFLSLMISHVVAMPWLVWWVLTSLWGLVAITLGSWQCFGGEGGNLRLAWCALPPTPRAVGDVLFMGITAFFISEVSQH